MFCCPDYNDCQIWGICDQLCEDRPGTHHCSCADGYFLEQGHVCKANASGAVALYSMNLLLQDVCGVQYKMKLTLKNCIDILLNVLTKLTTEV